ncbi:BPSS1780 family membrane protein [Viridibacterium curvum]|uniref:BPSS1780 family membrane protein n=1 Tax=Viridibacterium curvum TaxID=1101404 RepID=A0ABP9QNA7_9RHOO
MQAKKLPAVAGWRWLQGGLALWRRFPVPLSMAALLSMLLTSLPGAIPWLGPLLVCLMAPCMDVVLLHVCRQLATGRQPMLPAVRASLQRNLRGLLVLGLVMFLVLMAARGLRDLLAGPGIEAFMEAAARGEAKQVPGNVLSGVLVYWVCMMLMTAVMWVAPALTAFADVPPVKALFFAIVACWRNKAALLMYGFALMLLSIPLSFMFLLGQLGQLLASLVMFGVFMPACLASNYLSLVDIFGPLPEPDDAR